MKKLLIVSLLAVSLFLLGCENPDSSTNTNDSYGNSSEDEGSSETTINSNSITSPQYTMKTQPESGDTIAKISTNHGDIAVLLYTEEAPETTKNFIELSNAGKYEDVIFHRVIPGFMIQGGDFENGNGTGGHSYQGPGTSIQDEFGEGLGHLRGAVSMANAGPNTGGSQFFIVHANEGTPWLDGAHAVFGFAYEGMDVVDEITEQEIGPMDKPVEDVVIKSIEISTFK